MAKKAKKAGPQQTSTGMDAAPAPADRQHMSIRKIKNGHIVNRHGFKDGKHYDEEFYTPHEPVIQMGSPKETKARAKRLANAKL